MTPDAIRKAAKRRTERDLQIPRVRDAARRRACLEDSYEFLRVYFGGIFYQPFTSDRREMIDAIRRAAKHGGDQAVAGPRGDGKTRSALFVAFQLLLSGELRFPLIVSKSGPRAHRELKNLKEAIRDSDALLADFPEVVMPIVELGGWASRARQQTAFGQYTNLEWAEETIILPTIPTALLHENGWNTELESAARGQIAASLGVEGPIRGYSIRNERPDLCIMDDIDDRESARSVVQTETREKIIEEDIGGLAGPDKTIARVMLCTLINRRCIAAIYTDREKRPSWKGQRHRLLEKLPDRVDLWEEYIALRQGRGEDDPDARKAHEYLLARRDEMHAAAVVTNPHRYDARPLADGEPGQVSALQACYDLIADRGWDHFNTEYQNDPPEDQDITKAAISRQLIESRLSGLDRGHLPPESTIVIGVDVGKLHCHWVAGAFRKGGAGSVVTYGIIEVTGTERTDKKDVIERAIVRALVGWKDSLTAEPFRDVDGNPVQPSAVLIDSGYFPDAVYEFVRQSGGQFRASKGVGSGRFVHGQQTVKRRVGNHWHAERLASGVMLYTLDADYWKRSVHERFIAEPFDENNRVNPGSLTLFVPAGNRNHRTYSAHIMAEEWITEFIPGKGEKSRFLVHSGNNHYYDSTALMLAGAEMTGCGLFVGKRPTPPHLRPTLADLAKSGR